MAAGVATVGRHICEKKPLAMSRKLSSFASPASAPDCSSGAGGPVTMPAARAARMPLVRVFGEPLMMVACTDGGNRKLPMPSHNRLRPVSAPVLAMTTPTTRPTTAPSTKQPRPPVATVKPNAAATAAVARAPMATVAAISSTPPTMSASIEVCISASPSRAAHRASDMVRDQPRLSKSSDCLMVAQCAASAAPSGLALT
ncbi:hypothetical protein D3C81_1676040 [compost metagenome]